MMCPLAGKNSRKVDKCFAPGGRCQGKYKDYECSMKIPKVEIEKEISPNQKPRSEIHCATQHNTTVHYSTLRKEKRREEKVHRNSRGI
jgi:hypothetical protein